MGSSAGLIALAILLYMHYNARKTPLTPPPLPTPPPVRRRRVGRRQTTTRRQPRPAAAPPAPPAPPVPAGPQLDRPALVSALRGLGHRVSEANRIAAAIPPEVVTIEDAIALIYRRAA